MFLCKWFWLETSNVCVVCVWVEKASPSSQIVNQVGGYNEKLSGEARVNYLQAYKRDSVKKADDFLPS